MTDAATTPKADTKAKADKPVVDPKDEIKARLAALTTVAEPQVEDPAVTARKEIVAGINHLVATFTTEVEAHLGNELSLVDPEVGNKALASLEQARKHFVKAVGTISDDNLV